MNQHLQFILNFIRESTALNDEEKSSLSKSLREADKELEITAFELGRTEKVKAATAILLEETMAELEQKSKAVEAQNRELEIEASLERVRARAMAMLKSDDMANAVAIIFEELDKLNLGMLRCGIGILNKENRSVNVWAATKSDKNLPVQISSDQSMDSHPLLQGAFNAWLKQEDYTYELQGEDLTNYYKAQASANFKLPGSQSLVTADEGLSQYYFLTTFQAGGLFAFRETAFPDEAKKVMKRFAGGFNLIYKRFMDLQKAEAQAREAQIEVSLERVRSGSMAMHKSDELKDVVKVVFENLRYLGLKKMDAVNINIFHEGSKDFDLWLAAPRQDYTKNFRLPYLDHPIANDFFDAVERKEILHKKIYAYDEKNEYFKYMFENSDNKYLPEERKVLILNGPAYSVSAAIAGYSSIFVHNYQGDALSDEDNEILIRFSKVFDQAYKRYLDLHNAELLVREALKQASLDRIRAQVASMRSTADLQRITPLIWQELSRLDIPFIRCGVFIVDESEAIMQAYLSTPDGKSLGVLNLPFDTDEVTERAIGHWRKRIVFRHHWNKAEFLQWMQSMIDQGQIPNLETFRQGTIPPKSLELHFIPFTQGMLYVGSIQPLSAYELDLVKSLAEAFSVAYARYDDFNKLEKAKHSIETTLGELKAAQAQLIQAEKMASLGELTAGIAHEIQNPLNFVTNFSEVNTELIDELKEEQQKEIRDFVIENQLLDDIRENEQKINYHGKRADAIVKGMLQHSRATGGQRESTNINALADEYLRLTYHGLRAKNKSFNATFKTNYDETIGDINIVPQDFGRAMLNLITNAFYAVTEKASASPAGDNYQPTVSISTKKINDTAVATGSGSDRVEIRIKDNGNGIPKKILDKIFQPFFTTKPTGQGTGLGLSLAYDIVKAHGGELKVETTEGEETEFIIQLPV